MPCLAMQSLGSHRPSGLGANLTPVRIITQRDPFAPALRSMEVDFLVTDLASGDQTLRVSVEFFNQPPRRPVITQLHLHVVTLIPYLGMAADGRIEQVGSPQPYLRTVTPDIVREQLLTDDHPITGPYPVPDAVVVDFATRVLRASLLGQDASAGSGDSTEAVEILRGLCVVARRASRFAIIGRPPVFDTRAQDEAGRATPAFQSMISAAAALLDIDAGRAPEWRAEPLYGC